MCKGNVSSRMFTEDSGFVWPSVTICPMTYDQSKIITYTNNRTFEEMLNMFSMKDHINVKLWTDWFYQSEAKYVCRSILLF